MAQPVIQTAFHAGEWAPALNARVDMAKYHSAAALLENFFVDYRGGASSRPGTKYIIQAYKSNTAVRLITFQASAEVGYVLELGDAYIRFHFHGAPILEAPLTITGVTQANPAVVSVANTYDVGDWVQIAEVAGMTQLNGRYFQISARTSGSITLAGLNGSPINSTGYGAYTGGGTVSRIYTLPSPYAASELALIKFAQNVSEMILCHPNHQPYVLRIIAANDWTLSPISFGSTVVAPGSTTATTTLSSGSVFYSYVVTAIGADGQESAPSTPATLSSIQDLRTVAGTNTITWSAVSGATSYNVYKAIPAYGAAVAAGASFGYIGNTQGTSFKDSNIEGDFSVTPPISQNPFLGAGVQLVNITAPGSYTTVPSAVVSASSGGQTATVQPSLGVVATVVSSSDSPGWLVGQTARPVNNIYGNLILRVATITPLGAVTSFTIDSPGSITFGTTPSNPVEFKRVGSGSDGQCFVNLTWGVTQLTIISPGSGYTSAPTITFTPSGATAIAVLSPQAAGNPTVPAFFQQRLVLSAALKAPQTFNMSQPGAPYNFDIRNPILPDDAIVDAAISSSWLNTIRWHVPMPNGLITLSDRAAWLINGGSGGEGITPINAVANAQSYNGASDVPPIVANFDILYVQAKGSIIRDLAYNFYANVWTGTDISVLSSHLFFGYQILEWAWAEEPFKVVWAIRNDGAMLSLTFMKEQELVGWTHNVTQGRFTSVTEVTESVNAFGSTNAIYNVVERDLPGVGTVKYIERHTERIFPNGVIDAWCVDSGLQYRGAPATQFTGAEHLAGLEVTGLADGVVIPPFTMPADGFFTLSSPASVVTIGLAYTCNLQTLAIDLGEPTVQGKRKKITAVTVRAKDTLGIKIGSDPDNLTPMKDFQIGSMGTQTNRRVTDLVTGDGRTILDPKWQEAGQFYIRQDQPLPASILGVIPEVVVGDTPTERKER